MIKYYPQISQQQLKHPHHLVHYRLSNISGGYITSFLMCVQYFSSSSRFSLHKCGVNVFMETKKYLSAVFFPFLVCGCINMGSVLGNRRPAGDGN